LAGLPTSVLGDVNPQEMVKIWDKTMINPTRDYLSKNHENHGMAIPILIFHSYVSLPEGKTMEKAIRLLLIWVKMWIKCG